ncbi:shikimate kinase [bacterium]|nr:shikimate kinase [bacterium]MBU1598836.1 shikimate kinase [bacterium]
MKNIVLIGFMGSGKTSVAKELSRRLNLPYIDSDQRIEAEEKRPISQIFAEDGEGYFRDKEIEAIENLSERRGWIISTGGGVVLNPENIFNLKKNGNIFYLKTTASVIYNRIKDDSTRPLVNVSEPQERIEKLLQIRTRLYEEAADYIIDTSSLTVDEVVDKIIKGGKE